MLVLTRKLQEKIRIGDNVTVTVLRVKGNAVRIGIEAPQDVSILRGEIPRFEDEPINEDVDVVNDAQEFLADEPPINPAEEAAEDDAESQVLPRLTPRGASMIARVEQCLRGMTTQEV